MQPTSDQLMAEIKGVRDLIEANEAMSVEIVSAAVSEGIRIAVSDPNVWSAAIYAMQMRARQEAGGWMLGGIKAMASKLFWLLLIVSGVYAIGGWSALVALLKAR